MKTCEGVLNCYGRSFKLSDLTALNYVGRIQNIK